MVIEKNKKCEKDGIKLYRIREGLPVLNDSSIDYVVQRNQEDLPEILEEILSENPEMAENWRFVQLHMRAKCDWVLRHRRLFELNLIKFAEKEIEKGNLENAKEIPQMGRFAIRDMGQTVAAGLCLNITAAK